MKRGSLVGRVFLVGWLVVACGGSREPAGAGGPNGTTPADDASVHREPGSCENFSLRYGPVTLPGAREGTRYEVRLKAHAKPDWGGLAYRAQTLPPGLALTGATDPVIEGTPTSQGSFSFEVYATHGVDTNGCSTMPDPHAFRLEIAGPDAGTDAATDAPDGD